MSSRLHPDRGPGRPTQLDRPEDSCGERIATLPGSGKHVWSVVGPVASDWKSLSRALRTVVEGESFAEFDISIDISMIGRTKSTASPTIIFCSSDMAARRAVRKAVRKSGVLRDYPYIRLGDSPLPPLSAGESGPRGTPIPSSVPPGGSPPMGDPSRRILVKDRDSSAAAPSPTSDEVGKIRQDFELLSTSSHSPLMNTEIPGHRSFIKSHQDTLQRISVPVAAAPSACPKSHPEQCSTSFASAPENESGGNRSTGDPDDYDSFSETDSSEDLPSPDIRDQSKQDFSRFAKPTVQWLMHRFYSTRRLPVSTRGQDGQPTARQDQQASQHPFGLGSDSRKSKRVLQDEGGAEAELKDQDGSAPTTATKKRRICNQRGRVLACPFWKKDPRAFSDCYTKNLKLVKDVKRHLHRRHLNPIRCALYQVPFESEGARDDHVREQRCSISPKVEEEGISKDLEKQLKSRGPAGSTQEEQWFVMWGIIFPSLSPPLSPYLEGALSEEMADFTEFYDRYGGEIALQRLRGDSTWTDEDERRFGSDLLRDCLAEIIARWRGARNESSPSQPPPATPERRRDRVFADIASETPSPGGPSYHEDNTFLPADRPGSVRGVGGEEEAPEGPDGSGMMYVNDGGERVMAFDDHEAPDWYSSSGFVDYDGGHSNPQNDEFGYMDPLG